ATDLVALAIVSTNTAAEATASPEPTPSAPADAYSNTWYFGKSNNGDTEFALQNTDPYTYTVNGYSLVVDTKTNGGKLNNASRTDQWCQCNGGTTFIIPAYAGMKITWGRYTANESTGFKVDGTLYNEYYIADGTAENVSIIATGISYLSYIAVESVAVYDITGSLTVADSADLAGSSIKFTAANGQVYTAEITTGNAFSISLPAQDYTAAILNDSYVIPSASASVTVSGTTMTLPVSAATLQTVSGSVANPPKDAYKLTFTSATGSETTIDVDGGAASYTTQLYSGTYTVSSESGTLSPISQESFDVADADVVKNLYFPETITPAAKNTLTVGTQSGDDYETITDALTALAAGGQTNPTIILHSGETYQEQVIVNIANTTLKTDGEDNATITWYYGIGYTYYSLGTDGYYDKDRAMTKTGKLTRDPDRWGAVVRVRAANFKAENINFVNSFNQYYTEAEVKDGVEPNGCQSITVDRVAQTIKADAKTATERGAAIALDGDNAELYNCSFVGSQDTFYTYKNAYVKNCDITGNTDYIFGGGNVVFDNCNLIWGGYSSDAVGGYITADNPTQGDYYIFRNCTVKNATVEGRTYAGGNLGRDWGGEKAGVYYFNLKDETGKLNYTWTNMGGSVETGKANLHIYDFDPEVNKNYSSTGAAGANVNGVLSYADAKALYEGIISRIGFTPEHLTNAVTGELKSATVNGETAHGVLTTITAGSGATIKGIKWTVTNGSEINTFSTDSITSHTFPTITGGEATVAIIFNTEDTEATYNVLSQAIE
ncbi:MAG: pectinesterase family protein, partial [Candidatus Ornithomonoglobus sp.]